MDLRSRSRAPSADAPDRAAAVRCAWRLCHGGATLDDAFAGDGPAHEPKRWNHAGRRVVYASASRALAVLELLAATRRHVPGAMALFRADIPEDIPRDVAAVEELPSNWRSSSSPPELRAVADAWLAGGRSAVLFVPSSIVPAEWNVLLAPAHPDFARIGRSGPYPFDLDGRLVAADRS